MNPRPGEIWLADLGLSAKTRPVVILSRDDPQAVAATPLCQRRGDRMPLSAIKSRCARMRICYKIILDGTAKRFYSYPSKANSKLPIYLLPVRYAARPRAGLFFAQ